MLLLALFAVFGLTYWYASKANTDLITFEADRIKARNYALAGVEKAKLFLIEELTSGEKKPKYIYKHTPPNYSEFTNFAIDEGEYDVVSIAPIKIDGNEIVDRPHYVGKERLIGTYGVWEIVSVGKVKKSKIQAEISVIIKLYNDDIVYK